MADKWEFCEVYSGGYGSNYSVTIYSPSEYKYINSTKDFIEGHDQTHINPAEEKANDRNKALFWNIFLSEGWEPFSADFPGDTHTASFFFRRKISGGKTK